MKLESKLKKLRGERKITQFDLAQQLHVSRTLISSWETGRSFPDLQSIVAISDYFGVSLDYLLREDDEMIKQLTFDTQGKMKFKRLKVGVKIAIGIILVLLLGMTFVWQNQISLMNPNRVQIIKIKKVPKKPQVIDGHKIKKDNQYYVYLKQNDLFHDYDEINTSSNIYQDGSVQVSFQVKNSLNLIKNYVHNRRVRKFVINSFAGQNLTNNSNKDTYNLGKDIYLTDGNYRKLLIKKADNH